MISLAFRSNFLCSLGRVRGIDFCPAGNRLTACRTHWLAAYARDATAWATVTDYKSCNLVHLRLLFFVPNAEVVLWTPPLALRL
jgi:hypothetical protein